MAFDAQSTELLDWHVPTVTELPPKEAAEVRRRFQRVEHASDPLAGLSPKQIFFDCVWISEESTSTKIMLLCIGRFFDETAQSSSMAYSQVARECALHETTAKKIAKEVSGRWLRVGVGKGWHVPGKGAQNLYHGICPPEVVERLREQKLNGKGIRRDERIAQVAFQAADRLKKSGVAHDNRVAEFGVAPDHPDDERGSLGFETGSPRTTRTQIDSDDKKDSRWAHEDEGHDADASAPTSHGEDGEAITPEQFETFRTLADTFGRPPAAIIARPTDRTSSDRQLIDLVRIKLNRYPPDVRLEALADALLDAEAVRLRDIQQDNANKGQGGLPSLVRHMQVVLPSKADHLMRARDAAEAKNRTERIVQERIAAKRLAGIEGGGGGRAQRRGSSVADDIFEVVQ